MKLRRFFARFGQGLESRQNRLRANLKIEALESRLTPYSISGNVWPHPELVTLSLMPDGTNLGGAPSNLFSTMDARWSSSVWQREILRAAQVWAQVTNLNFALVNDNGANSGSGAYQQGDPGFGDIRIGAYNSGGSNLGSAMMPPPANNYSVAGDFTLNSSQPWVINTTGGYDVFTVASHEIGHTLGLYHSTVTSAEEYSFYNAIKSSLRPDDIAGVKAIYSAGLGRSQDSYDAAAANASFASATDLSGSIAPDLTALVTDRDITTVSDLDYYKVTAPSGTTGTMAINIQSSGLSMLMPTVTVYNALQQPIGSASGAGQYGSTLSVTVNGVTAGQLFYVKVAPAETSAFGTGKYGLTLNFGAGASPTVPLPSTQTANGSPIHGGGGIATRSGTEDRVNMTTAGAELTFSEQGNRNAVAMSSWGTYVVTWASQGQDGSGSGVFARMYGADGIAWTNEFQVNSFTPGDQLHSAVAIDDLGNFVITWASQGQDADGSWGIYAQRYNLLGLPVGGELAVANGLGDQKYPAIATAWDGKFAVTWHDAALDGSGSGVAARLYTAAGLPVGNAFVVNTTTAGDQTKPALAMDPGGNFVVTWTSQDPVTGGNVYAKLFNAASQVVRDEFVVNSTTAGPQDYAAVATADDGDFVITWSSYGQDGSGWGIYAQRFTLDGLPRDGEFRVNNSPGGDQWYSAIDELANGEALITWTEFDTSGATTGIFAQQFNAAGDPLGEEILVNTTQSGSQWYPSIGASDADGFAVVWSGDGPGDQDGVFTQRYQIVSISGGVIQAEDDFYGITEHGNGCGCAVCQAAVAAAPQTELVNELPQLADVEGLSALLAGTAAGPGPVAANGVMPMSAATPPVEDDRAPRTAARPALAALYRSTAAAPGADLFDLSPPAPNSVPAEAQPLPPSPAAPAAELEPLTIEIAARDSIDAVDAYFALEAVSSVSPLDIAPADETGGISESPTSLAGLGVVLGGLWAIRPEAATRRARPVGLKDA